MSIYYTKNDMDMLLSYAMQKIGIPNGVPDSEFWGKDLQIKGDEIYRDQEGRCSQRQELGVRVHRQGCPVAKCLLKYDSEAEVMSLESVDRNGKKLEEYSHEMQADDHFNAERNFFFTLPGVRLERERAAERNGGKRGEELPFYYTYHELEGLLYYAAQEIGISPEEIEGTFTEGDTLQINEEGEYLTEDGEFSPVQSLTAAVNGEQCPAAECVLTYHSDDEKLIFESRDENGNRLEEYSFAVQADEYWNAEKMFYWAADGLGTPALEAGKEIAR